MRCLCLGCPLFVARRALTTAQAPSGNAIVIGTRDSIWSPTLTEYRTFQVYTPPSYRDTTYLPQKYPVLCLLDGDAHFHSVTGLIQILGTGVNGTVVVPEMIVVAIPNTDRTRDLTPTHIDYSGEFSVPQLLSTVTQHSVLCSTGSSVGNTRPRTPFVACCGRRDSAAPAFPRRSRKSRPRSLVQLPHERGRPAVRNQGTGRGPTRAQRRIRATGAGP